MKMDQTSTKGKFKASNKIVRKPIYSKVVKIERNDVKA